MHPDNNVFHPKILDHEPQKWNHPVTSSMAMTTSNKRNTNAFFNPPVAEIEEVKQEDSPNMFEDYSGGGMGESPEFNYTQ